MQPKRVPVSPITDSAFCPFCAAANTVVIRRRKAQSPTWVLADDACEHANTPIDLGRNAIVIPFRLKEPSEAIEESDDAMGFGDLIKLAV